MTTQLSANEATKNLGERGKQQMTPSADKRNDDMMQHDGKNGDSAIRRLPDGSAATRTWTNRENAEQNERRNDGLGHETNDMENENR
jgi:hypothetical protein